MSTACLVVLGLAAWSIGADALRDVPKGYCHDCEVTCFEDCAMKYDREIIQPDVTGSDRLSRKDSRVEAQMKKNLYGVVLNQNGTKAALKTSGNAKVLKLASSYSSCLKQDKCPCSRSAQERGSSSVSRAAWPRLVAAMTRLAWKLSTTSLRRSRRTTRRRTQWKTRRPCGSTSVQTS